MKSFSEMDCFFVVNVSVKIAVNDTYYPNNGGFIALKLRDTWGYAHVSLNEGHVICRELGYPDARAVYEDYASNIKSMVLRGGASCQGNEQQLSQCDFHMLDNPNVNLNAWYSAVLCNSSLNLNGK